MNSVPPQTSGSFGLQLRRLRIESTTSPQAAEVTFRPGGNVIAGASNTGKTYIFQCIRFGLGGSQPPKPIPESAAFDRLLLVIQASTGEIYTIERSLRGGDVRLHDSDLTIQSPQAGSGDSFRTLNAEHDARNDNNLSFFLLGLCGLQHKRILGKRRRTEALSFRDVRELSVIDEQRILTETSPALSSNFATNQREKSVFHLLLTGADDSTVIAPFQSDPAEQRKLAIARLDAVVAELVSNLPANVQLRELLDQVASIDRQIAKSEESQGQIDRAVHELESQRAEIRKNLDRDRGRAVSIRNLLARFELLREKYQNDLARLVAFDEAAENLSYEPQGNCPLCKAPLSVTTEHHSAFESSPDVLRQVAAAELNKTRYLLADLQSTIDRLHKECESVDVSVSDRVILLSSVSQSISSIRAPALVGLSRSTTDMATERSRLVHLVETIDRVRQLQEERNRLAEEPRKAAPKIERDSASATEQFALVVEGLLAEWNYPELQRVTFNEKKTDLEISGKDRRSHGKGYRALTYAAFTIGLLDYLSQKGMPRSGFAVIDSPLTTLKARDQAGEDEIPADVKEAFYRSLANRSADTQVITIDNDEPPQDVQSKLAYVRFSGRPGIDRAGFIE